MHPAAYRKFTTRLLSSAKKDPDVIGLIAVGSMAETDYAPDKWSDHDFFLIVNPGKQEAFRTGFSWLPDAAEIVFTFRETAHGVKVVYRTGHLLEFAVFDREEIRLARINRYRLLLDRGDIEPVVREVAGQTTATQDPAGVPDTYLIGQFLTNLVVAAGRYQRGEKLSGRSFLIANALPNLARLLTRYAPGERPEFLDNLDPLRRFERAFPRLGAEINVCLDLPAPLAALSLLDLAERELRDPMPGFPFDAAAAVRRHLGVSL